MCSSPEIIDNELDRIVNELLDIEIDVLVDEQLQELLVSTYRTATRLAAVRAKLVSAWDGRGVWASNGARTPAVRLGNDCRLSGESAKAELRRARSCARCRIPSPRSPTARSRTDHVDLLGRANYGPGQACFADSEKMLVDQCTRLRFDQVERVVAYWRQHADAVGADADADRLVEQRRLSAARTYDGSVYVRALLDPIDGSIFLTELTRLERQLYDTEQSAGELVRTPGQRRADALVEMATRSASTPAGAQRPRPLYTVLVGYETFAGRICQLDDNTVIAPGQLLGGLSAADVERVVFDNPDRVIGVSARRRFTGALRRAVQVRDRHCQHPSGCDIPAPACDIDHIIPRSRHGPTSQTNGRLLCPTHNRHPDKRNPNGQPTIGEHHERPPPDQSP
ncbi:hypothetical protein BH18ACT3_BH18ACT3_05430 [soil metagenome]